MKKYTDEDVERLVSISTSLLDDIPGYWNVTKPELENALQPFLPDPEEALIEEMAREMQGYVAMTPFSNLNQQMWGKDYRDLARISLKIAKKRGLPPT